MKRKNLYILFALFLVAPIMVYAAGLVPCEGIDPSTGAPDCQLCYFVILVENIINWLVAILAIIMTIMIVVSGYRLVVSAGNPSEMQAAKSMITNTIIGFAIIMSAWLLLDYLMKSVLLGGETSIGPWNSIECVDQPKAGVQRIYNPFPDASRGIAGPIPASSLTSAQVAELAKISAPDDKVAAAAAAAGLDATQTKNLQALMRVESGGCKNNVSPVGALGCMQIMPATAKNYDPSLRGLSDAEVKAKLMDNDYNIALGAKIYSDLYNTYKGDERKIFAGYNAGAGANGPSRDCPGLMRWECKWDSPGCYGTADTSCKVNTGYNETRAYVVKVADVSSKLK